MRKPAHTQAHTHTHAHTHTFTHTHMHPHIPTYTHVYMHIHTCTDVSTGTMENAIKAMPAGCPCVCACVCVRLSKVCDTHMHSHTNVHQGNACRLPFLAESLVCARARVDCNHQLIKPPTLSKITTVLRMVRTN